METGHGGSCGPGTVEAVEAQMRARADGWATVNDPLSDITIDITKQCVNVSLSCDGGVEVGPAPQRASPFTATSVANITASGLTMVRFGAHHD